MVGGENRGGQIGESLGKEWGNGSVFGMRLNGDKGAEKILWIVGGGEGETLATRLNTRD